MQQPDLRQPRALDELKYCAFNIGLLPLRSMQVNERADTIKFCCCCLFVFFYFFLNEENVF